MPFEYDSAGVTEERGFEPIPDGWYPFRIVEADEAKSKNGHPMVKVVAECLDSSYRGRRIWHWVVFIPKGQPGDSMNVHFRKSIGVPHDGKVVIDADDWIGKTFMGKVTSETYNNRINNKFAQVSPLPDVAQITSDDPFGS
jgi:hypothetical protein